jgi:putative ABC transport system substrate-binding protein
MGNHAELLLLGLLLAACQLQAAPVPPAPAANARGGQTGLPRVVYIWPGPPLSGGPTQLDQFHAGLREYGLIEGQNLLLETPHVGLQPERYPALIADVIASHPDIIVAGDSNAAPLLAEATTTIPIVLTVGGNVVAAGMACAFNRPCGNVTGLSMSVQHLSAKRLQMLKDVVPGIRRVGFLRNDGIPETQIELEALEEAAANLAVQIVELRFRSPADFDAVFRAAVDEQIDGLLVMPDGVSVVNRMRILRFAAEAGLPDAHGIRIMARDGGLFAYGADRDYNYRRAAFYVDRLLRGEKAGDLPIEQPSRFELVINLARAQQLGLTFPSYMVNQAVDAVR